MNFILKIKILVLINLIYSFNMYSQAVVDDDLKFKNGDRWCAIGNSITHQGGYLGMIYSYYVTRYPYQHIELFNCGAGGDTSTGTYTRRMDKDILVHKPTIATIMLGMNDIWWENNGLFPQEYYSKNLALMIDRLKEEGSKVVLLTPSPYDYSVKSSEPIDPKRLGLERLANEVIELGKDKNVPVVEFYHPMLELTLEKQAIDSTFTLLVKDRVHTKPIADFIMGYMFLKATDVSAIVSTVEIDFKLDSIINIENCLVDNLEIEKDLIQFSVLEEALPYPKLTLPKDIEDFVSFEEELNLEILKINNLAIGQYTLYIDSTLIGDFSHLEFQDGINLACFDNTPQNQQANKIAELMRDYITIVGSKLRHIAMIEYGELKKKYDIDDVNSAEADIKNNFNNEIARFEEYLSIKKEESHWIEVVAKLEKRLWIENKPKLHNYRIKFINN